MSQTESAGDLQTNEIAGNRYLLKDWADGVIRFTSGREVRQFQLKFDCLKNQLLLRFQGSTFAAESKVSAFVIYTGAGKKKDSLVFRKGFPPAGKANENTFYNVLYEGKAHLLRLLSKVIIEEQRIVSVGGLRHHLEDAEQYFLFYEGNMIGLPSEKGAWPAALPDHGAALLQFVNEKNLKCKSPDDFVLIAKKYNELLQ